MKASLPYTFITSAKNGKQYVVFDYKDSTGKRKRTTASRYVNFEFKVKSSAMKILTPNIELVLPKFIYYRMQIIQFDNSTHKRYWIQKYSIEYPAQE